MTRKPTFARFSDLTRALVNRDLQVHTSATDGQGTIEELISLAAARALGEIAFTEHVRKSSTYFDRFADAVCRARESASVNVWLGIETKAEDDAGTLDVSPSTLARTELVLGSVHRFPIQGGNFKAASEFPYAEAVQREMALALGLLRHGPIHVLAHPGGMCQRAFGQFPAECFEELMRASLARGIAIEINTAYTQDLDGFLALCRKINPFISIGSDVHRPEELGTCRDALWARGIGCV